MAFSFIQITDHHLRPVETDLVRGMSTDNSLRAVLRHISQHAAPAPISSSRWAISSIRPRTPPTWRC